MRDCSKYKSQQQQQQQYLVTTTKLKPLSATTASAVQTTARKEERRGCRVQAWTINLLEKLFPVSKETLFLSKEFWFPATTGSVVCGWEIGLEGGVTECPVVLARSAVISYMSRSSKIKGHLVGKNSERFITNNLSLRLQNIHKPIK